MRTYQTPDNIQQLLTKVIDAARKTSFYSSKIAGDLDLSTPDDLSSIPVTLLFDYRTQRLADVLAEPGKVQWIAGALGGQSAETVAIAEGPDESAIRFDVFMDALKDCFPDEKHRSCVIVSSPERRYFAAETATILIHSGISTHVFLDGDRRRIHEQLDITQPQIIVLLVDCIDEAALPASTEICVTFRRSQELRGIPQLDMYLVDGLGFLGQSTDCLTYQLNNDEFLFEIGEDGKLVVTALRNWVRPVLRIEVLDRVRATSGGNIEFEEMSASP